MTQIDLINNIPFQNVRQLREQMDRLAVVIPAYREQANIVDLCQEILHNYPGADILVVDDSPDDLTYQAIQNFSHPQVRIMHRNAKGGRGDAVLFGLKHLIKENYDYFLEMDADFSHPPKQIPTLLTFSKEKKADLLIASRYLKESAILNWSIRRKLFSLLSNFLAKRLLQVPVSDYTNGFRLYNRRAALEVVNTCGQLGTGFIALSEILVNLHYREYKIAETTTIFINRVRGESSLTYKEISNALIGLHRIWGLKKKLAI